MALGDALEGDGNVDSCYGTLSGCQEALKSQRKGWCITEQPPFQCIHAPSPQCDIDRVYDEPKECLAKLQQLAGNPSSQMSGPPAGDDYPSFAGAPAGDGSFDDAPSFDQGLPALAPQMSAPSSALGSPVALDSGAPTYESSAPLPKRPTLHVDFARPDR